MAEAGKKREGFVHEAAQTSSAAEIDVLTFVLAGEQYAVNIDRIVEIIRPRGATRVPNAGANVVGIVSLRAAEDGRLWFTAFWRYAPLTALLYVSIVTHITLALWALYQRRHMRMPLWEIVRARRYGATEVLFLRRASAAVETRAP